MVLCNYTSVISPDFYDAGNSVENGELKMKIKLGI